MDDAALVNTGDASKLAFTVDFITPIVDDPEQFGAIAAANSISDVYAMGGEPSGLCVLGDVDPDRCLSQTGGRAGDRLVLTKPIGSGIAAQAIKNQKISEVEMDEVISALQSLNKGAKDAALVAGSRAATDVTGFGLLGHLHNLALGSGLSARLNAASVPTFMATRRLVTEGLVPGGSKNNLRYIEAITRFDDSVTEDERVILADAQTSGGLVIAVPPENEGLLLDELEKNGVEIRAVIGELYDGEPGHLEVLSG